MILRSDIQISALRIVCLVDKHKNIKWWIQDFAYAFDPNYIAGKDKTADHVLKLRAFTNIWTVGTKLFAGSFMGFDCEIDKDTGRILSHTFTK